MPEPVAVVEIPRRALFKAAEVCELLQVKPYVLKTWEAEFPDLGVSKTAGAPRVYRRSDVEQVQRIKHLLLVEGLTLAGARRRLDDEGAPVAANEPEMDELLGRNARERLTAIKRSLQSLLELLSGREMSSEFRLSSPPAPVKSSKTAPSAARAKHATPASKTRTTSSRQPAAAKRKRLA